MNDSFERLSSLDALYDASYKICNNVRWKDSTTMFEEARLDTILNTEKDLRNNEYKQMIFSCFSVIERGKLRDIRACHINDRLVQNSLCEQALLPKLTPKFVYDNCATLKNKGIDFALNRARLHLQQAHRTYGLGNDFFAARIDILKYFDSIDHAALKKMVDKHIDDEQTANLVKYFIDTFVFKVTKDKSPKPNKLYYITVNLKYILFKGTYFKKQCKYYEYSEKSLGLGSQASLLLALLTLNEIDHFIKELLHIKFYGRYMDDLRLFHNDSKYLAYCIREIDKKLQEIGLKVNDKKSYVSRIHPLKKGEKKGLPFKFLKWNFYLTDTNAIIQVPIKDKISKERRRLRKMHEKWIQGNITTEEVLHSYQGWRAHIDKGTTFYVLQDMDNYFHSLFRGVEIL